MKKIIFTFLILFFGVFVQSNAQTAADTMAIKKTILNYLEGYYTGNVDRMNDALYHDLAKRYVTPENEKGINGVSHMTAMQLVRITDSKKDDTAENGELKTEIKIFEIYDKVAIARSEGDKLSFVDFFHLGKINGEWKIINVIWALKIK